jgi:hypothetical protein
MLMTSCLGDLGVPVIGRPVWAAGRQLGTKGVDKPCLSIERSWELTSKKQGGYLDGKTCARRTVARVFESPCESRLHSCGSVWRGLEQEDHISNHGL